MKRVIFILMLMLLLLISCDDENKITSSSHPDPNILTNAQKMAAFYSEELYPPEDLTQEIYDELQIIRTEFGSSNRDFSANFVGPWAFSSVLIVVDDTTYESIGNGTNTWANQFKDSLNFSFSLTLDNFIYVHSSEVLNSVRLGELFIGLPGISYIQTNPDYGHYWVIYARDSNGNFIDYYFEIDCDSDLYFEYYRFRFFRNQLFSMKYFSECEVFSEIDWNDLTWEQIDSIYNSVYENTPDWVKEAYTSLRFVYSGHYFVWHRDTL